MPTVPCSLFPVPSPRLLLILASTVLLAFLLIPLAAIYIRVLPSDTLTEELRSPIVREALKLSLLTTGLTLAFAVAVGTPVAYLLARYRFRGREVLDTLVDLPMVLPPAAIGFVKTLKSVFEQIAVTSLIRRS